MTCIAVTLKGDHLHAQVMINKGTLDCSRVDCAIH